MERKSTPETLAAALAEREAELDRHRRASAALQQELDDTNRGLIALVSELEAARLEQARLAAIVTSSTDAMISIDPERTIRTWNPGAQQLLGHLSSEIIGRPVETLLAAGTRETFESALARLRAGERTHPYDTRWSRADGSPVDVAVTISAMRDGAGELIGHSLVARDITQRLATQAHLTEVRAQNEVMAERDRIARDLHDMAIQRVFAAGMALQSTKALISSPEARERIRGVVDELDTTIHELRGTIFDLQNPAQDADLGEQVLELTAAARRTLGFVPTVTLQDALDEVVPARIRPHLLAVLREALSNVARHARATAATVALRVDSDLVLEISDNGRGFDSVEHSSGLTNMRERALSLGGVCAVTGVLGSGTSIEWRVPLDDR